MVMEEDVKGRGMLKGRGTLRREGRHEGKGC